MKKVLIASAAALAVSAGSAFAADLAPVPYYKASPPLPPACIWCGFYIGANVGGAWTTTNDAISVSAAFVGVTNIAATSERLSGIIGGGQIGYNWQFDRVVLGVEADIDVSSQRGTATSPLLTPAGTPLAGVSMQTTNRINDFGTARARLGVPFGHWMPYVTGGFAWQDVSSSLTGIAVAPAVASGTFPLMSNSTILSGWTVGGGVEAALWGRWSVRAEYLYIDTGRLNTAVGPLPITSPVVSGGFAGPGTIFNESTRFTNSVLRVGLDYRFGGPMGGSAN
jgi:outer membrane immunogenic protein